MTGPCHVSTLCNEMRGRRSGWELKVLHNLLLPWPVRRGVCTLKHRSARAGVKIAPEKKMAYPAEQHASARPALATGTVLKNTSECIGAVGNRGYDRVCGVDLEWLIQLPPLRVVCA